MAQTATTQQNSVTTTYKTSSPQRDTATHMTNALYQTAELLHPQPSARTSAILRASAGSNSAHCCRWDLPKFSWLNLIGSSHHLRATLYGLFPSHLHLLSWPLVKGRSKRSLYSGFAICAGMCTEPGRVYLFINGNAMVLPEQQDFLLLMIIAIRA